MIITLGSIYTLASGASLIRRAFLMLLNVRSTCAFAILSLEANF